MGSVALPRLQGNLAENPLSSRAPEGFLGSARPQLLDSSPPGNHNRIFRPVDHSHVGHARNPLKVSCEVQLGPGYF